MGKMPPGKNASCIVCDLEKCLLREKKISNISKQIYFDHKYTFTLIHSYILLKWIIICGENIADYFFYLGGIFSVSKYAGGILS